MVATHKALILTAIFFLFSVALEVSGYTNLPLAIALWGVAAVCLFWWLWRFLPENPFQRKFMGPLALFLVGVLCVAGAGVWYFITAETPDMPSMTTPTEAQRQAPVSVTIVHGGVNYYLSPDLTPGLARSATDAAKATESPEPRSLIQAAEYMLFAAEADGNQPPLAVNEWTRIYFHTELRDSDFGYDEQSSVYTNEKTSLHQFDVSVNFVVLDEKADEYRLRLVTSNRIYEDRLTSSVLASRLPFRATVLSNMDAADTAYYEVMQIGGTASTVIKAGSYFMGRRLGGKL